MGTITDGALEVIRPLQSQTSHPRDGMPERLEVALLRYIPGPAPDKMHPLLELKDSREGQAGARPPGSPALAVRRAARWR